MPENYADNELDMFPDDTDVYRELLSTCQEWFSDAQSARTPFEERWRRFYRLYRAYTRKREAGDWRHRVFIPETFKQIETILPRLVAQLPRFLVQPVGEEDVEPAKVMEFLLNHAAEQSGLYVELVKTMKDALMYGTGILKVYFDETYESATRPVPVIEEITQELVGPVLDPETGQPMRDIDGRVMMDQPREEVVGEEVVGFDVEEYQRIAYEGPMAEAVDLFNFWVAPEAEDLDKARYVVHRTFIPLKEARRRVEEGIYRWPEFDPDGNQSTSEPFPSLDRLSEIGLGSQPLNRKDLEVLEFHTDDGRVITMLNRAVIVRVQRNAYWHRQKPFVRFVDYLMPHEFYGIGEIEIIEGLQDAINATQNRRMDEVLLKLHKPMAGNPDLLVDLRDLGLKPGQFIRTRGDIPSRDVLHTIDLGDVNTSAYAEVDSLRMNIQEVTGVSNVQQGIESAQSETATGTAILQEMGATRFGFKSRLFELEPLKRLGKQFGSILQQFTPEERVVRMLGPQGEVIFDRVDPLAIQGALDYSIETASILQSETVKRDQANALFQTLSPLLTSFPPGVPLPPGVVALIEDLLEAHGKRDKNRYLQGASPMPALPLPNDSSEVPPSPMAPPMGGF